jgi:hypothetical protein
MGYFNEDYYIHDLHKRLRAIVVIDNTNANIMLFVTSREGNGLGIYRRRSIRGDG